MSAWHPAREGIAERPRSSRPLQHGDNATRPHHAAHPHGVATDSRTRSPQPRVAATRCNTWEPLLPEFMGPPKPMVGAPVPPPARRPRRFCASLKSCNADCQLAPPWAAPQAAIAVFHLPRPRSNACPPQIDPKSAPPRIDPRSTPSQSSSTPDRPPIEPQSTPHRPQIGRPKMCAWIPRSALCISEHLWACLSMICPMLPGIGTCLASKFGVDRLEQANMLATTTIGICQPLRGFMKRSCLLRESLQAHGPLCPCFRIK